MAKRFIDARVEVTLDVVPEMPHNAPLFAAYHPEAQAATDRIGGYFAAKLDGLLPEREEKRTRV